MRSGLILVAVLAALAGGGWFVYTNLSYGPLEEHPGRVVRAEYKPEREVVYVREDEDGNRQVQHDTEGPSWLVAIAWANGTHESRSQQLYSQVQVGSEVTLHVRPRLWRSRVVGWSVQAVSP